MDKKQLEEETNKSLEKIINKGKVTIELPYTSSGVMLGYGTGTRGGMWGMGSKLGEGTTEWRQYDCYLVPGGLSVEKTGDFISFDKILNYHKGERQGLLIKHTNITLELAGEKTFTFRLWDSNIGLLKIIEANMRKEEPKQIKKQENTDNIDQLMKAKKLLDAGLLTMEEFNKLKEKILK